MARQENRFNSGRVPNLITRLNMNESLVVLCWICGKLVPESEADAHCAEHEKEEPQE